MPKLWEKTEECIQSLLPQSVIFINRLPNNLKSFTVAVLTDNVGEYQSWQTQGWPAYLSQASVIEKIKNVDVCCVALRKGRDNQLADIALGWQTLRNDGTLLICGYNDDGVRTIEKIAKQHNWTLRQVVNKSGGRTLMAKKEACHDELLESWWDASQVATTVSATVVNTSFKFVSLPGTFASGKLDDGTKFLLEALAYKLREPILDLACGCGTVAAFVAARGQKQIIMSDVSAQALQGATLTAQLAGINPPIASDGFSAITQKFSTILLNPPFHQGVATEYDTARKMILDASRFLRPKGRLIMVANRFLPYEAFCRDNNIGWHVLKEDNRFKVLQLHYHQEIEVIEVNEGVETVPEELWEGYYKQAKQQEI